jgi:hypothetical protein
MGITIAAAIPWMVRVRIRKGMFDAVRYPIEVREKRKRPEVIKIFLPRLSDNFPIRGSKKVLEMEKEAKTSPMAKPVAP